MINCEKRNIKKGKVINKPNVAATLMAIQPEESVSFDAKDFASVTTVYSNAASLKKRSGGKISFEVHAYDNYTKMIITRHDSK